MTLQSEELEFYKARLAELEAQVKLTTTMVYHREARIRSLKCEVELLNRKLELLNDTSAN
jgi:hypothetical protein